MATSDEEQEPTGGIVWPALDDEDDDDYVRSLVDRRRTVLPVRR